jgi:predicted TIM-barrel fold metal-dependent hydrolase
MPEENMTKRLLIVSTDAHCGLAIEQYGLFIEQKYQADLDALQDEAREFAHTSDFLHPFPPETLEIIDDRNRIRSGGETSYHDAGRRLRELDAEGIAADILHPGGHGAYFPFFGNANKAHPRELMAAGARAYNRWLAEFCKAAPERLIGLAQVVIWPDMDSAMAQLRGAAKEGMRGALPPVFVGYEPDQPQFHDPYWDPFWATCVELDFPISMHDGFIGFGPPGRGREVFEELRETIHNVGGAGADQMYEREELTLAHGKGADPKRQVERLETIFAHWWTARRPLWQLALGGVLDRFPKLKIAFVENNADWVPTMLAYLDRRHDELKVKTKLKPSEYWRRNFSVGAASIRPSEVKHRHEIGLEQLTFGSDFPHGEGTWPNTLDWLRKTFAGVPENEARLILGENAVRFWNLDRAALETVADRIGPEVSDVLGGAKQIDPRMVAHWDQRSGYLKDHGPDVDLKGEAYALVEYMVNEDLRTSAPVA